MKTFIGLFWFTENHKLPGKTGSVICSVAEWLNVDEERDQYSSSSKLTRIILISPWKMNCTIFFSV